ncbi:MAG: hypothetical protein ABRQ39_30355, partial [Candidatus Eremiobacterota bacterium]
IDKYQARIGLMNETEKRRHRDRGYGTSSNEPSVISLNSTVVSLTVTEIVKYLTGLREPKNLIIYDALNTTVVNIIPPEKNANCPVCSRKALYARGDEPCINRAYMKPAPSVSLCNEYVNVLR